MLRQALAYIEEHQARFVQELLEFLSIPSVSAQPEHARDVHMAAFWLAEQLRHIGLRSEVLRTGGHPLVYAEWRGQDLHAPTVLIYGHYDVQPPEPMEQWHTPPFAPELREGYIYARGASDNKGQHFAHVKAVEALLRTQGTLPVNIKFLIEGEEEIGSPSLGAFIAANTDLLRCDCVLISDSAMRTLDQPTLVYGLRGLISMEVTVRCLERDVHSGHYGGLVQNPIFVLAQMLAQVKDAEGRVRIPGFYEDVRVLDDEERAALARVPYTEADLMRETGARCAFGEPEFSLVERRGARPTFEVNGIWGGYTGPGTKTVIPAEAHAKITCRLVPYQDPHKVAQRVAEYLRSITPPGATLEVRVHEGGSPAVLLERDHPAVRAAVRAATDTYHAEPIFELEGGSIPVVAHFRDQLRAPVVLLGFGLPDDNIHAPNERFSLQAYQRGIEASARFLLEMSACCAGLGA